MKGTKSSCIEMFVLYETPAGYAIFKVSCNFNAINSRFGVMFYGTCDEACAWVFFLITSASLDFFWKICSFHLQLLDQKKLEQVDNLYLEFETPEKANQM